MTGKLEIKLYIEPFNFSYEGEPRYPPVYVGEHNPRPTGDRFAPYVTNPPPSVHQQDGHAVQQLYLRPAETVDSHQGRPEEILAYREPPPAAGPEADFTVKAGYGRDRTRSTHLPRPARHGLASSPAVGSRPASVLLYNAGAPDEEAYAVDAFQKEHFVKLGSSGSTGGSYGSFKVANSSPVSTTPAPFVYFGSSRLPTVQNAIVPRRKFKKPAVTSPPPTEEAGQPAVPEVPYVPTVGVVKIRKAKPARVKPFKPLLLSEHDDAFGLSHSLGTVPGKAGPIEISPVNAQRPARRRPASNGRRPEIVLPEAVLPSVPSVKSPGRQPADPEAPSVGLIHRRRPPANGVGRRPELVATQRPVREPRPSVRRPPSAPTHEEAQDGRAPSLGGVERRTPSSVKARRRPVPKGQAELKPAREDSSRTPEQATSRIVNRVTVEDAVTQRRPLVRHGPEQQIAAKPTRKFLFPLANPHQGGHRFTPHSSLDAGGQGNVGKPLRKQGRPAVTLKGNKSPADRSTKDRHKGPDMLKHKKPISHPKDAQLGRSAQKPTLESLNVKKTSSVTKFIRHGPDKPGPSPAAATLPPTPATSHTSEAKDPTTVIPKTRPPETRRNPTIGSAGPVTQTAKPKLVSTVTTPPAQPVPTHPPFAHDIPPTIESAPSTSSSPTSSSPTLSPDTPPPAPPAPHAPSTTPEPPAPHAPSTPPAPSTPHASPAPLTPHAPSTPLAPSTPPASPAPQAPSTPSLSSPPPAPSPP